MFTLEYFKAKFEATPDNLWITGVLHDSSGGHCAIGHCGGYATSESYHLQRLIAGTIRKVSKGVTDSIPRVNDDVFNWVFEGDTPKDRILNIINIAIEDRDTQIMLETTQHAVDQTVKILNEESKIEFATI